MERVTVLGARRNGAIRDVGINERVGGGGTGNTICLVEKDI